MITDKIENGDKDSDFPLYTGPAERNKATLRERAAILDEISP